MINEKTRTCVTCGEVLRGRADKKFCSDYCRSVCHNQKSINREYVRRVNYILGKNRRILGQLHLEGKKEVPVDVLKVKGFDFNYFTSVQKSAYGQSYYCYEIGFAHNGDESSVILFTGAI